MAGHRTIGVISDTHSLLRPEALAALRGSDVIVHAGDVGDPSVLEPLRAIAPLYVVRGNIDRGPWADELPHSERFEFEGKTVYLVHDPAHIEVDSQATPVDLVITGHTHHPKLEERDGVLYVNPGSAGPRRFKLPVAIARVDLRRGRLRGELVSACPERAVFVASRNRCAIPLVH